MHTHREVMYSKLSVDPMFGLFSSAPRQKTWRSNQTFGFELCVCSSWVWHCILGSSWKKEKKLVEEAFVSCVCRRLRQWYVDCHWWYERKPLLLPVEVRRRKGSVNSMNHCNWAGRVSNWEATEMRMFLRPFDHYCCWTHNRCHIICMTRKNSLCR